MFGEDASALHALVSMVVNKKIEAESYGQKYLSPVDSEDLAQGVLKLLEDTPAF